MEIGNTHSGGPAHHEPYSGRQETSLEDRINRLVGKVEEAGFSAANGKSFDELADELTNAVDQALANADSSLSQRDLHKLELDTIKETLAANGIDADQVRRTLGESRREGRVDDHVGRITEQLQASGITTTADGQSLSELAGLLKSTILQTIDENKDSTDKGGLRELIREAVRTTLNDNGIDPDELKEGLGPDRSQQSDSFRFQLQTEITGIFNGSTDPSRFLNGLAPGAGLDLVA